MKIITIGNLNKATFEILDTMIPSYEFTQCPNEVDLVIISSFNLSLFIEMTVMNMIMKIRSREKNFTRPLILHENQILKNPNYMQSKVYKHLKLKDFKELPRIYTNSLEIRS
ncbi:hypothetical protein [Halobacteriovorax sp. CON-3]|uniref:hypothetical protein n=1 Tax=Halobacteriovorax sp. CON-3 TaxID=3157710 RepID=UPI00370F78B1